MIRDFRKGSLYGIIGRRDLRLFWSGYFSADRDRLPQRGQKNLQLHERRIREPALVYVGSVLRNREPFCSPSGQPTDLSGEAEFYRVDNAALPRSVRPGVRKRFLLELKVQLPDASHFFDVREFELYQ